MIKLEGRDAVIEDPACEVTPLSFDICQLHS